MKPHYSYQDIGYIKDGCLFVLEGGTPRTGFNVSFVTPSNLALEILSVRSSLSTAGVGADRICVLNAFALGRRFWDAPSAIGVPTGSELNLTWAESLSNITDGTTNIAIPSGRLILPPSSTLEISSFQLQPTDAFGPTVVIAIAYPLK